MIEADAKRPDWTAAPKLDHARLSHLCFVEFGGDESAVSLHANQLIFTLQVSEKLQKS